MYNLYMIDLDLRTITESGLQVSGKILGNELSDTLLICSHGFGVKSDSWGMFNIICEALRDKCLTIRFHYVSIDDFTDSTYVYSYSKQVEKLETVIQKMQQKYGVKKVVIIGHSQGCLIPCIYLQTTNQKIEKLLLLSPSPSTNIAEKMKSHFGGREGSEFNLEGLSVAVRSNGSKTYIPKEFWIDAEKTNPIDLFTYAIENQNTYFIRAKNDTVVSEANNNLLKELNPKNYYELPNDHDYKEDNRVGLLSLITKILSV